MLLQSRGFRSAESSGGENGADMAVLETELERLQLLQQRRHGSYVVHDNYSIGLRSEPQSCHDLIVDSNLVSADHLFDCRNRAENCVGVEDLTKFGTVKAMRSNCSQSLVMNHCFEKNFNCQAAVLEDAVMEEEKDAAALALVDEEQNRDAGVLMGYRESNSWRSKRKAEYVVTEEFQEKRTKAEVERTDSRYEKKLNNLQNSADSSSKENSKLDYIRVRARRGQATDNHSLAERARREKIRQKMKCLQDLVPGCNKVTGKAGMLDEIINYVQSLQSQVEFLSMKLAAMNPASQFNIDNFSLKEFPAYMASFPAAAILSEGRTTTSHSSSFSPLQPYNESSSFSQMQSYLAWDADMSTLPNPALH